MRIGIDVGGTNTDAVLLDGRNVIGHTKQPTSDDISSGVVEAIRTILDTAAVDRSQVCAVMIGTTQFTNALVQRSHLNKVAIVRLASPSGEALPPLTGWPEDLVSQVHGHTFLLPGGYEFDGREIAPFDGNLLRAAVAECQTKGIDSFAVSSAFGPLNSAMETQAADIIGREHRSASISLSHAIGRIGLIERENSTILNAALARLGAHVIGAFEDALDALSLNASLYISQNDGTLVSSSYAAQYPVMTIGSGPTNSMRGAAFLSGLTDAVVIDVGGTTSDIGVLAKGFPRESSIPVDIGGVRTNFRMPDILALGIGGGSKVRLETVGGTQSKSNMVISVGPDSVGKDLTSQSFLFGGDTLTTSDIAVAAGKANFGDAAKVPDMSAATRNAVFGNIQSALEHGVDRLKTRSGDVPLIVVGGGGFLIQDPFKGAQEVIRPHHSSVANAVGAAIAQVGAQSERVVDYDLHPRDEALEHVKADLTAQLIAAGGEADTIEIVEIEEGQLSYLPGRTTQLRVKAVANLNLNEGSISPAQARHAY